MFVLLLIMNHLLLIFTQNITARFITLNNILHTNTLLLRPSRNVKIHCAMCAFKVCHPEEIIKFILNNVLIENEASLSPTGNKQLIWNEMK